jgi:hypothetical protein
VEEISCTLLHTMGFGDVVVLVVDLVVDVDDVDDVLEGDVIVPVDVDEEVIGGLPVAV